MPASPLHSLLDPHTVSVCASLIIHSEKRLLQQTQGMLRSPKGVEDIPVHSETKNSPDSPSMQRRDWDTPIVPSSPSASSLSRVRFQVGTESIIPNNLVVASEMDDFQKSEIWWQQGDYYMFKKTSKMIASEMRRRQSIEAIPTSYSSIMERTYSVCCQTAEESNNVCPLSKRDLVYLEKWKEHGISRRGLERWSFPKLAKERQRRKEVAIRGVIEVQNRFVRGMNLDSDTGAEFIRKSSEQLTRYEISLRVLCSII